MAKINFGGTMEDVVTAEEFTVKKAREVLKNEVIAVLGYGVQGPARAFNMKDKRCQCDHRAVSGRQAILGKSHFRSAGFPVRHFFRLKKQWRKRPSFNTLVSDAAQMILWPKVKAHRRSVHLSLLTRLLHRLRTDRCYSA